MAETKKDYSKSIGYILFIIALIGWGFSAGKFDSRMENFESELKTVNVKLEKQQDLLLQQQQFNGKVLNFMEMISEKEKNK